MPLTFNSFDRLFQHGRGGLWPEKRLQRLPLGRLAVFQETGDIVGEEGERFVIGPRVSLLVAARDGQSGFNLCFESAFGMAGHGSNFLH